VKQILIIKMKKNRKKIIFITLGIILLFVLFILLSIGGKGTETPSETGKRGPFTFFPFRGNGGDKNNDVTSVENIGLGEKTTPTRFLQLTKEPVAGFGSIVKEKRIETDLYKKIASLLLKDFTTLPILRIDTKEDVTTLQTILTIFDETFETEEGFNESTKNTVIAFQDISNLTADGIVGQKTYSALKSFLEKKQEEEVTIEYEVLARYVDRATGHIFEIDPATAKKREIVNSTIPSVHEAFFNDLGNRVVMRYLSENNQVETLFAKIPESMSGSKNLEQIEISNDKIVTFSISPDKKKYFALSEKLAEVVISEHSFDKTLNRTVLNSPFFSWIPQWLGTDKILLVTKPSAYAEGFVYIKNTTQDKLEKIQDRLLGLTVLGDKSGKYILFSYSNNESISNLFLKNTQKDNNLNIGLKTFPEKCAWGGDSRKLICGVPKYIEEGIYPDDWYMSIQGFSDDLWVMVIDDFSFSKSMAKNDTLEESGKNLDIILPEIDKAEKYFFFINKKDNTLWRYSL